MAKELLAPDYIFESSWEVCNKVGGIYTVLSTRAKTLQDVHKDKVIFIGPDFWVGKENPLFIESDNLCLAWREHALKNDGLKIRVGRWNIPGEPIVFLVDFFPFFAEKDAIYGKMWEDFRVDSLHAYGDYDEASMFSYAAGKVVESFYRFNLTENDKVIYQAHEWMTGLGALYLQKAVPQIATIFTTHATSTGRSIASNGKPLYDFFEGYNGDQMAAEQGFYGIVAVMRAMQGKNSLYRMSDCNIRVSGNAGADTIGLPGKHTDVNKTSIIAPGKTFDDISAHKNQPAIEALIARGIINGMGDDSYAPDETMTRAQFATIVVKALGLTPKANNVFADVPADEWYTAFVGTAYTYGIVNGTSATTFEPEASITKQEAATMVARAAKLCGMDTQLETYEILNALAQFGDYVTVDDWARESTAFCYSEDILDQNDLDIEPKRAILRCEIAQMLYNMLGSAKLL